MQLRLILLVGLSSVLAVIAVSALLAPIPPTGDRREETRPGTQPSTPEAIRTDLQPASGEPFVLSADETDQVVALAPDREARIQVHATGPVSVQLGEHGPVELAEPGTPAEFAVFGDPDAEGPIRLPELRRAIGRVELSR